MHREIFVTNDHMSNQRNKYKYLRQDNNRARLVYTTVKIEVRKEPMLQVRTDIRRDKHTKINRYIQMKINR